MSDEWKNKLKGRLALFLAAAFVVLGGLVFWPPSHDHPHRAERWGIKWSLRHLQTEQEIHYFENVDEGSYGSLEEMREVGYEPLEGAQLVMDTFWAGGEGAQAWAAYTTHPEIPDDWCVAWAYKGVAPEKRLRSDESRWPSHFVDALLENHSGEVTCY